MQLIHPTTRGLIAFLGAVILLVTSDAHLRAGDEVQVPAAIEKAIPLIEKGASTSLKKRACFMCHHTAAPLFTLDAARRRGFEVDTKNMDALIKRAYGQLIVTETKQLGRAVIAEPDMSAWALVALNQVGWSGDVLTEKAAEYLIRYDADRLRYHFSIPRPPTAGSDFTSTWVSLVGMLKYANQEQQLRADLRATVAGSWLEATPSVETEDQVYRLRSLKLLGFKDTVVKQEADKIIGLQHDDGGWAQLPKMKSDAYATGTVLAALYDTGQVDIKHPSWTKGVTYLLENQTKHGSWHVKTRSRPFQPFYDSDFPHGRDQFISYSATCWSTYVLLQTIAEKDGAEGQPYLAGRLEHQIKLSDRPGTKTYKPEQLVFFKERILPVLTAKCYSCHSSTTARPKGGLRLDSQSRMLAGGTNGGVIVPGKPEQSLLIKALHGNGMPKMPTRGSLSAKTIADFEKWIKMGAPDTRVSALREEIRARTFGRREFPGGSSTRPRRP